MTIIRRIQSVATAGKSTFIYDYLILDKKDLEVFQTLFGQAADDDTDRLTLDLNYSVQGVGDNAGGTIELALDAAAGDIITIIGKRPVQPPANFQPGQLSAEELNNAIDGLSILIEDVQTQICSQMVSYDASNVFNVNLAQNKIPILSENEAWVGGINNAIVKVTLPDSVLAGILRAQLADDQPGTDGSRIVGYSNTEFAPNDTTVHDAMARLDTKVAALEVPSQTFKNSANIILGGDFSVNPFQATDDLTVSANTREYVADGWLIDQIGTMELKGRRQAGVPTITGDLAPILFTAALAAEISVNQPALGVSDFGILQQPIEGTVFRPLAIVNDMIFSFWVLSPLAGIYYISFRNSGLDRTCIKKYTITNANTWQLVTFDVEKTPVDGTWLYGNGIGLTVTFTLAAGTNFQTATVGTWQTGNFLSAADQVNFLAEPVSSRFVIADVSLIGKNTFFPVRRNFQETLEFAQRYFEKSWDSDVFPGTITDDGAREYITSGTDAIFPGFQSSFLVAKRIIPAMKWFSPVTGTIDRFRDISGGVDVTVTGDRNIGENSTGTPTSGVIGDTTTLSVQWTADARL